jgi:hypothetical protein
MDSYNKVLAVFLLFSIMVFPALGQSQIYHCQGTWTNQPCSGATPEFAEIVTLPDPVHAAQREKESILHQLIEARYQAKHKFSLDINTSSVEKFCQLEQTSVSACQERVDVERDKIDSKIIEYQKLKLQKEELALKNQALADRSSNNSTAVIIQNFGNIGLTPTGTVTVIPIGISPPLHLPRIPETRIPAPSRGEVPNDARVPLRK